MLPTTYLMNKLCGRPPQYAPPPASDDLKNPPDHLSVWWPWPLTFWPWNWCALLAAARTTFSPILMLLRLFFVELWANTRQNDDVTL